MIVEDVNSISRVDLIGRGVRHVVFESDEADASALFCALTGTHTDGHKFIDAAYDAGCRNFLIHRSYTALKDDALYIKSDDTRVDMAKLASIFYDAPGKKLKIVGVTGTDGKSTTVYLIAQLLELCGKKTGLISTVNYKTGSALEENLLRQSTPEAPQIERALASMVENGMEYAVVEATSHGLAKETGRLSMIPFLAGVFTNVTIEHLEFHKTLEKYRHDKANLFRAVAARASEGAFGVINAGDEHYQLFADACGDARAYLYGEIGRDLWAENVSPEPAGTNFTLVSSAGERTDVRLNIPGLFNVENALAAVLCATKLLNKSLNEVASMVERIEAPRGRMKVVIDRPFTVMVDYAHTPGAFEKLLPQLKNTAKGRLIVVFGSGGERNLEKRPIQGELADRFADIVILTDEDPRLENRERILADIAAGVKNKILNESLFLIPDRREALKKAFTAALPGDVVALLGKGHESCILTGTQKLPWNEEEEALALLKAL